MDNLKLVYGKRHTNDDDGRTTTKIVQTNLENENKCLFYSDKYIGFVEQSFGILIEIIMFARGSLKLNNDLIIIVHVRILVYLKMQSPE